MLRRSGAERHMRYRFFVMLFIDLMNEFVRFAGRYGECGSAGPTQGMVIITLEIPVYVRNFSFDYISGSVVFLISSKNIKLHKKPKKLLTF